MVMSQGTYTFLACFAGFWLVWAIVVMLCCFCSFLQRRLKRHHDERLREQCLRAVEMEPLSGHLAGYPAPPVPPAAPPAPPPAPPPPLPLPREPPQFCPPQTLSPPLPLQVPHPMPQANWVSLPDSDIFGKPPCYEEAVLMEDPPPPYSEVLADPRGGTYLKPAPLQAASRDRRNHRDRLDRQAHLVHMDPPPTFTSETSKPHVAAMFPERGYSSLIRLPSSQCWDSLGHLLSNMDLNHNNLTPPGARPSQASATMATMPRREPKTHNDGLRRGIQGLQGGIQGLQGGIHGLQGGIQGLQGGIQGLHGGLQGVHGLRGLESSCGLPTAFPLLGRSTAV